MNFDIVSREKDDQEIWLAHKEKTSSHFKQHIKSTQEIRFDKAKVLEHKDEIANFISLNHKVLNFIILQNRNFQKNN